MALLTMIIPKGRLAWAENRIVQYKAIFETENPYKHAPASFSRALQLIKLHAETINKNSVILHVGGNVRLLLSYDTKTAYIGMGNQFHYEHIMDTIIMKKYYGKLKKQVAHRKAATIIQKYYRGWKVRLVTTFNPTTTLGTYIMMRDYHTLIKSTL